MASCLYRLQGREVIKVSHNDSTFDGHNEKYFGVLENIKHPDGTALHRELANGELGPPKEPGYAKIAVVGSNSIRNAKPSEISKFITEEAEDEEDMKAEAAIALLDGNEVFAKAFAAMLEEVDALGQSTLEGAKARVKGKRQKKAR